uniref:Phostensin/Taperin PP1-binding domain-containing protein n=1 Tax=Periophthalmus magnuspinnatus TaxID=409849 RepID=A0A3B3ZSI9_9GOBI
MSVSSLPEWKQLLLERKRREEEAREQREKQEEQKLANMPAWKRGIIQRRKAKQDGPGEVPDPGLCLDGDPKYESQVSLETIVPVNENPFIRIQKRKGKEVELCSPKSYDGEAGRGSHFEVKMEKFRDLSEGKEKDQSNKQTDASWCRSVPKERDRNQKRPDKESLKIKKEEEYRDTDSASPVFSPTVPCLRTIRADNIIIIEQERNSNEDHVESLKEKMKQQLTENVKEKPAKDVDHFEVTVTCETVVTTTMAEAEKEQEVDSQIGQSVEVEKEVETPTSERVHDVPQEVSVSPQLPDSKSEVEEGEEVDCTTQQLSQKRIKSPEDQSIEINPAILHSHSPENALKILDLAPTPVSSPCSPSPAQSPNNSPAPSPTPTTLFTIKSASGGQVKRGATITITPKKTQVQGSSPTTTRTTRTTSPTSPTSNTTKTVNEPGKKKYPTVEEIEVIGGYLNLDKSCLVKNKGISKKVCYHFKATLCNISVCFSEERLEQLCEYPSETSIWAGSPYPLDLDWTDPDPNQDEEIQMETVSIPKATRSVGTATGRGLRVGQCHPLLKKHSV